MILALAILAAAPYFTGQTAKPPVDVARCTAAAWEGAQKRLKVRTEVRGDGFAVVAYGSSFFGGSDMTATIPAQGEVTMTRRPALWGKLDDKMRDGLRSCL